MYLKMQLKEILLLQREICSNKTAACRRHNVTLGLQYIPSFVSPVSFSNQWYFPRNVKAFKFLLPCYHRWRIPHLSSTSVIILKAKQQRFSLCDTVPMRVTFFFQCLKVLLPICLSTRGGCWRCRRHHCGFKRSEGYSGDCIGEQRRQYFPLHLCSRPGGTSHRLCDLCWAADSQKPFHCPHLRG